MIGGEGEDRSEGDAHSGTISMSRMRTRRSLSKPLILVLALAFVSPIGRCGASESIIGEFAVTNGAAVSLDSRIRGNDPTAIAIAIESQCNEREREAGHALLTGFKGSILSPSPLSTGLFAPQVVGSNHDSRENRSPNV